MDALFIINACTAYPCLHQSIAFHFEEFDLHLRLALVCKVIFGVSGNISPWPTDAK